MLDIKEIRQNREEIEKKLKSKESGISLSRLLDLDESIRDLTTRSDALKAKRNADSKKIGELKRQGQDVSKFMDDVAGFHEEIADLDKQINAKQIEFTNELARLPNIPMDDIKISADPKDNVVVKVFGKKPSFEFKPKNHMELNESLHLFDFVRGAKISGTGWPVYKAWGARLEWALLNYMLNFHIERGFIQWIPPLLVRPEMMFGSGQLPKFEGQFYSLKDDNLYLVPTSEIALNALHYDEILEENDLPLKYVAYTPCFRREAGAAGSQERGLIRVHQFNKVEMFCFTRPEDSPKIFNEMVESAEKLLEGLGLHFRNTLLVTGDMSFGAAKTIDIEAWLPGQDRYYEVSSVSNCTDFQSRRSKIRFRTQEKGKTQLVHTLNGSGLATSRLMVALLENNQNPDGSVNIPHVLRQYLGGKERLEPINR